MARPRATGSAQLSRSDKDGSSASNKPFPQRYTVVEHHPGGSSTVSQSSTGAVEPQSRGTGGGAHPTSDTDRFAKNSKAMENRAMNDLRDTLRWVSRLSSGPVDRRLLRDAARSIKPNAYRDVMTERWVADMCAYPACDQMPRRAYNAEQPMYRINLRAKRVFDTSAAMKFCSDDCARRSIWFETVCLQQNAFEMPDLTQPVQLLEDMEMKDQGGEKPSRSVAIPSEQLHQLEAAITGSEADASKTLSTKQDPQQYAEQAENFLARLSIVERQATGVPLPPSEDYADEINQEDNPALSYLRPETGGPVSSTFNMDTLGRALPPREEEGTYGTVILEERAGLARRIEIDVDPEYRDLMDAGFELYKQMKEAGEFT